ncbi:hypothetical protein [Luteipulveratus mongoliensis]|uniref:hypothetical protein n=1 Tax=Luteipulveratus mongoliensis TaxID=571913 RepID=UPI0012ED0B50|nr:hypothetical protein [Luteipulveratus mongoliensis]
MGTSDLKRAESGMVTATRGWTGPRKNDFTDAGAGMQIHLKTLATALTGASGALHRYATVLRTAQQDIARYAGAAQHAADVADRAEKNGKPDVTADTRATQAANHNRNMAGGARSDVHTAKTALLGKLHDIGTVLVPGTETLTDAQVAQKVLAAFGQTGLPATGATKDQAWGALAKARTDSPTDVVRADGTVAWAVLYPPPTKPATDLSTLGPLSATSTAHGKWGLKSIGSALGGFVRSTAEGPVRLVQGTAQSTFGGLISLGGAASSNPTTKHVATNQAWRYQADGTTNTQAGAVPTLLLFAGVGAGTESAPVGSWLRARYPFGTAKSIGATENVVDVTGPRFWTSWPNYPKVTVDGKSYAQIGDRLYSRHAVDRMQPSGMRYSPHPGPGEGGKTGGMPEIRQVGGDYGRGVAPRYIEDVIMNTKGETQVNGNTIHDGGSLEVILSPQGRVVTVITK